MSRSTKFKAIPPSIHPLRYECVAQVPERELKMERKEGEWDEYNNSSDYAPPRQPRPRWPEQSSRKNSLAPSPAFASTSIAPRPTTRTGCQGGQGQGCSNVGPPRPQLPRAMDTSAAIRKATSENEKDFLAPPKPGTGRQVWSRPYTKLWTGPGSGPPRFRTGLWKH